MAQLILSKDFLGNFANLQKATQTQVRKLIDQFENDPNHPSLHREHYNAQVDPRAQTLRVNDEAAHTVNEP